MSVELKDVITVVAGILSDPGTSSKDHQRIVTKAIDIVKEVEFQVGQLQPKATAKVASKAVTAPDK